jgi:hypothetical protein
MLERFKDEIPNLERLVARISKMLNDPSIDLEDIREEIYEHIMREKETGSESEEELEEIADEALLIAFNAVDDLIYDLEVNKLNFKRLMKYIRETHCYAAYDRLFWEFGEFMSESERKDLLEKARKIFVKEITKNWE